MLDEDEDKLFKLESSSLSPTLTWRKFQIILWTLIALDKSEASGQK